MKIAFVVPGKPMGKGRPRMTTAHGFARAYTPKETANYEQWVRLCYMQQCNTRLEGQLSMDILAVMEPPKSWSKRKIVAALNGELKPTMKPDLDNIAKIVADALNGLAYRDDSCIVDLTVRKRYGAEARVEVSIYE